MIVLHYNVMLNLNVHNLLTATLFIRLPPYSLHGEKLFLKSKCFLPTQNAWWEQPNEQM